MRLLLLGGTTEASALAKVLAIRADVEATLSLAGRTEAPAKQPLPTRIGGFGGVDGLVAWLAEHRIDVLIDATHPFAAQMSLNAAAAARIAGVPVAAFGRPAWEKEPGDRWIEVADLDAAARAIGETKKRVLLTTGRLGLAAFEAAPQHHYVIRTIEHPGDLDGLPDHVLILDRGPFDLDQERALMTAGGIEVVVTKNSGGEATRPKLTAARELGIPVVIVQPPARPEGVPLLTTVAEVTAFLDAHRPASPTERGE